MSLNRFLLAVSILLLSLASSASAAEPVLAGRWRVKSATFYGKPAPDEVGSIYLFGKDFLLSIQHIALEERPASGTVDLTAKPWTIDLERDDDRPAVGGGGPREGIIELKGDVLTICVNGTAKEPRPKKFESKEGQLSILIVMERVKK